jgi:integrase
MVTKHLPPLRDEHWEAKRAKRRARWAAKRGVAWEDSHPSERALTALKLARKFKREEDAERRAPDAPGGTVWEFRIEPDGIGRPAPPPPPARIRDGLLAAKDRWLSLRGGRENLYQAEQALALLEAMGRVYVDEVSAADLHSFTDICLTAGYAPATIERRLSCLSVLGVMGVTMTRVTVPTLRPRKWYLRAEDERRLPQCPDLAPRALVFINWTCATGLRIEESLRLRWLDVSLAEATLRVPGTKTAGAEGTIALSDGALAILKVLSAETRLPTAFIFPLSYQWLRLEWQKARSYLGFAEVPTATLKILRRSFARRAHLLKGMPTSVLQQYLGHEHLRTTEGYLHFVGGYGVNEQR